MKVTDLLPMAMQPAILPHIGRLLDSINGRVNASQKLSAIAWPLRIIPRIAGVRRILDAVWKYAAAPIRLLFSRLVPRNMFWAALVPHKVQATVHVVVDEQKRPVDCCIWVYDGWSRLWCGGAFGKGILSRSDATWMHRYQRDRSDDRTTMYLEDITLMRRQDRQRTECTRSTKDVDVSQEELPLMEPFQLSPYEALFLSDLGCLEATDATSGLQYTHGDLWRTLHAVSDDEFELKYAAYYYYRAKGWAVRSGIKFGSDFLLYKSGGPSKSHSQYSVIVRRFNSKAVDPEADSEAARRMQGALGETWQYMFALSRVTAQAQKSLLVCYVDPPSDGMRGHVKAAPDLHLFGVQEIMVQRFNPNKK
ncbi:tRNA splicing endonuclease subunit sen2 [Coemansia sp. IMI 209127]|nr:tRNA splicing endonuclease subunit sen2 [Coemansia sp. IMI 209127]